MFFSRPKSFQKLPSKLLSIPTRKAAKSKVLIPNKYSHSKHIWKTKALLIICYIKFFIDKLKEKLEKNKIKRLNEKHLRLLNDLSYLNYNEKSSVNEEKLKEEYLEIVRLSHKDMWLIKKKKIIFYFKKKYLKYGPFFERFIRKIPILMPNNKAFIFWEFFKILFAYLALFFIPFQISFEKDIEKSTISKNFTTFIITLEILITLIGINTAFYSKEDLITSRKKIAQNFIQKNFFISAFVILLFIISNVFKLHLLKLVYFVKFFKMARDLKSLTETDMQMKEENIQKFQLFKLLLHILYVTHLCSCSWHYLAQNPMNLSLEMKNTTFQNSWLFFEKLIDEPWYVRYIHGLFYSVLTMITVGMLQIRNPIEQIFSIFIMLVLAGGFAYSINLIGIILQEISKDELVYRKKLSEINQYMNRRQISNKLQIKIRRYLEYMHIQEKNGVQIGEDYIKSLPITLQNNINIEAYSQIFKDIPFFKNNTFSKEFLEELSLKVKEVTFSHEELIQNKGEIFGMLSLFPLSSNKFCFRSKNLSHVWFISTSDFFTNYEKYCEIRDKIILYKDFSNMQMKCFCCGKNTHFFDHCPMLRLYVEKEKIFNREFSDKIQKRCLLRRRPKKVNSKKIYKNLEISLKVFKKSNKKMLENVFLAKRNSRSMTIKSGKIELKKRKNLHSVYREKEFDEDINQTENCNIFDKIQDKRLSEKISERETLKLKENKKLKKNLTAEESIESCELLSPTSKKSIESKKFNSKFKLSIQNDLSNYSLEDLEDLDIIKSNNNNGSSEQGLKNQHSKFLSSFLKIGKNSITNLNNSASK